MNEDIKKYRMEMINQDIEESIPFEEDYKAIKKKYEEAKTDADWFNAIDEHDYVNEEELKYTRKILAAFKRKEPLQ